MEYLFNNRKELSLLTATRNNCIWFTLPLALKEANQTISISWMKRIHTHSCHLFFTFSKEPNSRDKALPERTETWKWEKKTQDLQRNNKNPITSLFWENEGGVKFWNLECYGMEVAFIECSSLDLSLSAISVFCSFTAVFLEGFYK
jgi:hypothetical protein